jgi:hypothetical protein
MPVLCADISGKGHSFIGGESGKKRYQSVSAKIDEVVGLMGALARR